MSRLSKGKDAWLSALDSFLSAWLIACGLSLCASGALYDNVPTLVLALLSMGWTALFCLVKLYVKRAGLLALLILAPLSALGIMNVGPFAAFVQAVKGLYLYFMGLEGALAPFRSDVFLACAFLFSLLAVFCADERDLLSALSLSALVVLPCYLLSSAPLSVFCALPVLLGLLTLLSRVDNARRAAPVALVGGALLLAAFLMTPALPKTEPTLAAQARRLRETIEDYLVFNKARAGFSLSTEGYLPLADRLGGAAHPENHPVMEVETDSVLRLRAVTYDTYTGLNWRDTISDRRYLWQSPRWTALKEALFDMALPLNADIAEKTATIHLLTDGATTLFAPQRLRDAQTDAERMILYFNKGTELFITRDTTAGDAYTARYLPLTAGDKATEALVRAGENAVDAHYQEIADAYLKIPEHMQEEIFTISAEAVGAAQSPYDKAIAIENYLAQNYRYTLDVAEPPDNVDFVAYFLLGEKQGYCTYFASALTILCRMVGVPARYVTGFLAVPDENGIAQVTGADAHAWAEIYLNGFGWLALDATPKRDAERDANDGESSGGQSGGAPTPTPSPTPAPTPSPEPDGGSAPSPSPSPSAAPTVSPSVSPSPAPDANEPARERQNPFPWLFLLLLLAALAIALLLYLSEPVRRAKRRPGCALFILNAALFDLLRVLRLTRGESETLAEFAARAAAPCAPIPVEWLAADYAASLYGKRRVDAGPFADAYAALQKRLTLAQKIHLRVLNVSRILWRRRAAL